MDNMEITLIPFAAPSLRSAVEDSLKRLGYLIRILPAGEWLDRRYEQVGKLPVLLLGSSEIPLSQIDAGISDCAKTPIFAVVGSDVLTNKRAILTRCSDFSCWPCSEQELACRLGRGTIFAVNSSS